MISTKGRYALRVMIDLAEQNTDKFVPLDEITLRQGISKKYLESILKILVSEKLVRGLRRKSGGYKLTHKPEEYTAREVLELTEGTLATVACLRSGSEPCLLESSCKTLPMWRNFDNMVYDFFSNITIWDLVTGDKFDK